MRITHIPERWAVRPLIEVATLQRGFDLPIQSRIAGNVPIVAANSIVGSHSEVKVRGPGVVTGRSGSIGNVLYVPGDYWPLNTALYVKDFHGNHPRYIYYLLREMKLERFHEGTGVPTLNRNNVHNIPVPVPLLPEQRRIAAILDQADLLRAKRRETLVQLDNLTQSIFIEMFGRQSGLPTSRLDKIALLKRGPFGGALKKEIFVPVGPMVYEQRNAIQDDCLTGRYFISEAKFREMEDFAVLPKDLIVSCSGTIGKVAIAPQHTPRGIINQALLRIRVDTSIVTPLYLKHALESQGIQNQLAGLSRGTGLQNFPPMAEIKALVIPLPSVEKQQAFETVLLAVGRQRAVVNEAATNLDSLFASLQHRAFRGEL